MIVGCIATCSSTYNIYKILLNICMLWVCWSGWWTVQDARYDIKIIIVSWIKLKFFFWDSRKALLSYNTWHSGGHELDNWHKAWCVGHMICGPNCGWSWYESLSCICTKESKFCVLWGFSLVPDAGIKTEGDGFSIQMYCYILLHLYFDIFFIIPVLHSLVLICFVYFGIS